jgi:HEAT repeat protein
MLATVAIFLLMLMPPATPQERNFVPVEGAGLLAKQETAAARAAAASPQSPFWTAYSFDVRPGVATDFEFVGDDGIHLNIEGSSVLAFDPRYETRNLAVFMLRPNDGRNVVTRLEVYNLSRKREYGGYPVYWAGRATNDESLAFLRGLAEMPRGDEISSHATRAIGLHDDRRVPSILESLVRTSKATRVRGQAVRWLGYTTSTAPATPPLLVELARNSNESGDIRRAAISAIGLRRDAESLSLLLSLYESLTERGLRRSLVSAISRNENRSAAAAFLINLAERDPDADVRKQAIMQLGEIAGDQALGALSERATSPDDNTEMQKAAVIAISRRAASESVPLLINIARTHPKLEVRKQAFLQLGRSGNPTAVSFLKEVLLK